LQISSPTSKRSVTVVSLRIGMMCMLSLNFDVVIFDHNLNCAPLRQVGSRRSCPEVVLCAVPWTGDGRFDFARITGRLDECMSPMA
jgi:hypothetical protein